MPVILRYDLDYGSLGALILSASTQAKFLKYPSISWRSERLAILLVEMTMSLLSIQMKSAMIFDLMFLRALLILITWVLEFFRNFLILLMFIGTMTCLCNDPFVVILILSLLLLLMSFWTCLIFLFWRTRKAFLIFRVSMTMFNIVGLE